MVALPRPQSQVPGLIYAAREAEAEEWDSLGFSPSALGSPCDRDLWMQLHWVPAKETKGGQMLRLLETGNIQEERLIADLRRAGLEVYDVDPDTGRQFLARALAGHVRGKLDGICTAGIPEAPTKVHVVECKSHGEKSWKKLVKAGNINVKDGKFDHWVQCQVYMHIRGIDRCLYVAVRKADDAVECERLHYDHDFCTRLIARLDRLLRTNEVPSAASQNDKMEPCLFCRAKPNCRGLSFARLNCRTCLHATPEMSGDAAWSCARWTKPLTLAEQKEACPAHLYIPGLVPGALGDVDEAAETITYTLNDGRIWVDGKDEAEAPVDASAEGEKS
jgi:hypothetical protein